VRSLSRVPSGDRHPSSPLEPLHQVSDPRALRTALDDDFLPLNLGVDDLAQNFGIRVAELSWVPLARKGVDEVVRQSHLFLVPALAGRQ
jgi:hypothetical protein